MPKVKIRPIGSVLPVDKHGFIVKLADVSKIREPWLSVTGTVKGGYLEKFGERVHSTYVRGSVAKGEAIEHLSDVDTIAVIEGLEVPDVRDWSKSFNDEMKQKFPFCQKIELGLVPIGRLMDLPDSEYSWDRLVIKTQSVCIYGHDLSGQLPGFKPGRDTLGHLFTIGRNVENLKTDLMGEIAPERVRQRCVWVMKRLLRAGYELVMEREHAYTRDLYPCYAGFAKHYPEQAEAMLEVLDLALNPTNDKNHMLKVLDGIGGWISSEVSKLMLR